jgi:hypothetical protein
MVAAASNDGTIRVWDARPAPGDAAARTVTRVPDRTALGRPGSAEVARLPRLDLPGPVGSRPPKVARQDAAPPNPPSRAQPSPWEPSSRTDRNGLSKEAQKPALPIGTKPDDHGSIDPVDLALAAFTVVVLGSLSWALRWLIRAARMRPRVDKTTPSSAPVGPKARIANLLIALVAIASTTVIAVKEVRTYVRAREVCLALDHYLANEQFDVLTRERAEAIIGIMPAGPDQDVGQRIEVRYRWDGVFRTYSLVAHYTKESEPHLMAIRFE